MRVLHLVAGELTGGAARGAYWLHRGLMEIGVDSIFLQMDGRHMVIQRLPPCAKH